MIRAIVDHSLLHYSVVVAVFVFDCNTHDFQSLETWYTREKITQNPRQPVSVEEQRELL